MTSVNTSTRYGLVARTLHWLTALLVFIAFPLGYVANTTPLTDADTVSRVVTLFSLHKTVGVMALALGLARIAWRVIRPRPAAMPHGRAERVLAETTHWTLSIALVVVPLTGWLAHSASPDLAPIRWPLPQSLPLVPATTKSAAILGAVHWTFTKVLAVAVLLHVAGALKHALIDRDATLARMTRGIAAGGGTRDLGAAPLIAAVAIWAAALAGGLILTEPPPAPPRIWSAEVATVSLLQDGELVGEVTAYDITLSLAPGGTGTLDIFAALDSIDTPAAAPVVSQLVVPILSFSGQVAPDPEGTGLAATGPLDVAGTVEQATIPLTRDGDVVHLGHVIALMNAASYAIGIEATFERPPD